MVASVSSPADVANLSLARIGWKGKRIGSLLEGSMASKLILDVFSQTRDAILETTDWDFAERNVDMTLLKQAPPGGYIPPNVWNPTQYPALPWLYSYAYSQTDIIKVRAIRNQPIFVMDFDPQPIPFQVANDNTYMPAQKVILCNVPSAILVYTGQITDFTVWETDAIEALAAALARRIAPSLANMDAEKIEAMDEAQSLEVGYEAQD